MIEDQIALMLKELRKLQQEFVAIKKDIKEEEKNDSDEYRDLKKALKDLKAQVKDYEDRFLQDLLKDDSYVQLKDLKMKKEEEIALTNQKLFELIAKLPPKFFQLEVQTDDGPIKVQVQPEMRLYLNGREEKKRA